MRYFLFLLILLPLAQAAPLTVEDARLEAPLSALAMTPESSVGWRLSAEHILVQEYESDVMLSAGEITYWSPANATTRQHHRVQAFGVSEPGALLVVLSEAATVMGEGTFQVSQSTVVRVEDRQAGNRHPAGRDTSQDLMARELGAVSVQGDFLLGLDRSVLRMEDGSVYDSRRPQGPHAGFDALHHVVLAQNATLTLFADATAWFPHARITYQVPDGVEILDVHPGKDGVEAQRIPAPLASVAASAAPQAPPATVAAAAAVLAALVAILAFLRRGVDEWTERADVAMRREHLLGAFILARLAVLRSRGSADAASLLGQVQDKRGRFRGAYHAHARAAHLYAHREDRAHAAFDAAVAAANLGWGRRSADMLVRAVEIYPDMALQNLVVEPAFNLVVEDPCFQRTVGNHFAA